MSFRSFIGNDMISKKVPHSSMMATASDLVASQELLQECKDKVLGHMKHAKDMFLEDYLGDERHLDNSTTSQLKRIKCLDEY